jgi:hypothetical protein
MMPASKKAFIDFSVIFAALEKYHLCGTNTT